MATSYSQMLGLPAPPVTQVRRVCLPLLLLPTCAAPRIRALRHCSTRGNPRHDVLHAHVLLLQCLRNTPLPCPGSGGWRGQPHLLCAVPAPQRHQGGRLLWHAAPLSHAAASPPTRAHSEALSAACGSAPRTHPPTQQGRLSLRCAEPLHHCWHAHSQTCPVQRKPTPPTRRCRNMQVPVMQSDLSFSLLYGSNLPEALIRAVPALLAEFPAGLLTPAGTNFVSKSMCGRAWCWRCLGRWTLASGAAVAAVLQQKPA